MPSPADRIPEPTSRWTEDHDPNPLEGVVTARRDAHSTKFDKDFVVLEVVEDSGRGHGVPCGRADLAAFARRFNPQEGDRVALRYWGQQGLRHSYTGVSDKGAQGRLQVAGPLETSPPLTDDDYMPESSA